MIQNYNIKRELKLRRHQLEYELNVFVIDVNKTKLIYFNINLIITKFTYFWKNMNNLIPTVILSFNNVFKYVKNKVKKIAIN